MRDFIASESDSDAGRSSDSSFKPPVRPPRPAHAPTATSDSQGESTTEGSLSSSDTDASSVNKSEASAESDGTAEVANAPSAFVWRTPPHASLPRPTPLLPPPLPNRNRYPKRERREAVDLYLSANARRVRRVLEQDELRDQVREIADVRGVPIPEDNMDVLVRVASSAVRATHARVMQDVNARDIELASQEDDTDADAEEDSDAELDDAPVVAVRNDVSDAVLSD
jgi:hypothetical protein